MPAPQFEFDFSKLAGRIGEQSFRRLQEVLSQYSVPVADPTFQVASSIINRSEIELLGLSSPRFVYRMKLVNRSGHRGFVGIRRLNDIFEQLVLSNVEGWDEDLGSWREYEKEELIKAREVLAKHLEGSIPFAESILPAPDSLNGYSLLDRDFSRMFGQQSETTGTPYLGALPLGGGVCAHAVIFMAQMLMEPFAKRVLCPSELALLLARIRQRDETKTGLDASKGSDKNENHGHDSDEIGGFGSVADKDLVRSFSVEGLLKEDFQRLFREARGGLECRLETCVVKRHDRESSQLVASDHEQQIHPHFDLDETRPFVAMSAYVQSGFPVILVVDGNRYVGMLSKSEDVYSILDEDSRKIGHCVLVVGCGRISSGRRSRFVVHDPNTKPHLELSEAEIRDCLSNFSTHNDDTAGQMERVQFHMLPVLPPGVALPLLDEFQTSRRQKKNGLMFVARMVQSGDDILRDSWMDSTNQFDSKVHIPHSGSRPTFGRFWLISKSSSENESWKMPEGADDARLEEFLDELRSLASSSELPEWIWVQIVVHSRMGYDASYWVWDATRELPASGQIDIANHLIWCSVKNDANSQSSETRWTRPIDIRNPVKTLPGQMDTGSDVPTVNDRKLDSVRGVSLVSSCYPDSLAASLTFASQNTMNCEIYAFMQTDVQFLLKLFDYVPEAFRRKWFQVDLPALMDWIGQSPERSRKLANAIHELCNGLQIVGLASYLPEIARPPESSRKRVSAGALRLLVQLGIHLKSELGHDNFTSIEFVAGSRCIGLDWSSLIRDFEAEHYRMRVGFASKKEANRWVLSSLKAATAGLEGKMSQWGIALAAELEPGDLNVLSTPEDLCELVLKECDSPLRSILGANFDIGHFCIARNGCADESKFETSMNLLMPLFVHCHINSHFPYLGHFCDCPIWNNRPLTDFDLDLLHKYNEICRESKGSLPISRYVSVELEAPECDQSVVETVASVKALLEHNH